MFGKWGKLLQKININWRNLQLPLYCHTLQTYWTYDTNEISVLPDPRS